jgi:hypothetical protein
MPALQLPACRVQLIEHAPLGAQGVGVHAPQDGGAPSQGWPSRKHASDSVSERSTHAPSTQVLRAHIRTWNPVQPANGDAHGDQSPQPVVPQSSPSRSSAQLAGSEVVSATHASAWQMGETVVVVSKPDSLHMPGVGTQVSVVTTVSPHAMFSVARAHATSMSVPTHAPSAHAYTESVRVPTEAQAVSYAHVPVIEPPPGQSAALRQPAQRAAGSSHDVGATHGSPPCWLQMPASQVSAPLQ